MPETPANLVYETSTTTGTGNLTVAGVNGKQRLSTAFGTGGTDVFDYFISNRSATEWERGTGHMSDANTLVRDTVIESTNSNAAVDFSAGTKDVTNAVPAGALMVNRGTQLFFNLSDPGADALLGWDDSASAYENLTAAEVRAVIGDPLAIANGGTAATNAVTGLANLSATASGFNAPLNLGLAVSAAGSALTIALKGADGNDPSATNPVVIPFRNVTQATGTPTTVTVTAATSLVISSGSTLGVTSSTAFRLWVVGFNDGGTFRLGVKNCSTSSTTATTIYPLHDWTVDSSTAEGGAGAADSAGVFYTGTAVTSKAQRILGFIEWSATGLTAGTWTTTDLNVIQIYGPGIPLPGQCIQSNSAVATPTTTTTSSTYIATSQTLAITPTSAANIMRVRASGSADGSASDTMAVVSLSRGTTNNTNIIGSEGISYSLAGEGTRGGVDMTAYDKPNVTSSQTYAVQIKRDAGSGNARWTVLYNAVMLIEEVMG